MCCFCNQNKESKNTVRSKSAIVWLWNKWFRQVYFTANYCAPFYSDSGHETELGNPWPSWLGHIASTMQWHVNKIKLESGLLRYIPFYLFSHIFSLKDPAAPTPFFLPQTSQLLSLSFIQLCCYSSKLRHEADDLSTFDTSSKIQAK